MDEEEDDEADTVPLSTMRRSRKLQLVQEPVSSIAGGPEDTGQLGGVPVAEITKAIAGGLVIPTDERTITVLHCPSLGARLAKMLCGRPAESRWRDDPVPFDPGIELLKLVDDKRLQDPILRALADHGWYLTEEDPELPSIWALRYEPGSVGCGDHKDISPVTHWSMVVAIQTQGESILVQLGPDREKDMAAYPLNDGDVVLFPGALLRHETTRIGDDQRVVLAWHLKLSNPAIRRLGLLANDRVYPKCRDGAIIPLVRLKLANVPVTGTGFGPRKASGGTEASDQDNGVDEGDNREAEEIVILPRPGKRKTRTRPCPTTVRDEDQLIDPRITNIHRVFSGSDPRPAASDSPSPPYVSSGERIGCTALAKKRKNRKRSRTCKHLATTGDGTTAFPYLCTQHRRRRVAPAKRRVSTAFQPLLRDMRRFSLQGPRISGDERPKHAQVVVDSAATVGRLRGKVITSLHRAVTEGDHAQNAWAIPLLVYATSHRGTRVVSDTGPPQVWGPLKLTYRPPREADDRTQIELSSDAAHIHELGLADQGQLLIHPGVPELISDSAEAGSSSTSAPFLPVSSLARTAAPHCPATPLPSGPPAASSTIAARNRDRCRVRRHYVRTRTGNASVQSEEVQTRTGDASEESEESGDEDEEEPEEEDDAEDEERDDESHDDESGSDPPPDVDGDEPGSDSDSGTEEDPPQDPPQAEDAEPDEDMEPDTGGTKEAVADAEDDDAVEDTEGVNTDAGEEEEADDDKTATVLDRAQVGGEVKALLCGIGSDDKRRQDQEDVHPGIDLVLLNDQGCCVQMAHTKTSGGDVDDAAGEADADDGDENADRPRNRLKQDSDDDRVPWANQPGAPNGPVSSNAGIDRFKTSTWLSQQLPHHTAYQPTPSHCIPTHCTILVSSASQSRSAPFPSRSSS
jgi:hypothetical protein